MRDFKLYVQDNLEHSRFDSQILSSLENANYDGKCFMF